LHQLWHQQWHQLIGNGEFQLSFSRKHFFAAEKVLITFEQNMSCMAYVIWPTLSKKENFLTVSDFIHSEK
jgi:hypothetical protein